MNIDPTKKYGLLLSGGLDSAVLLYLMVKSCKDINLQTFTIPKHDGASLYAEPIVKHINNKFGSTVLPPIYVGDPNVHHSKQSSVAIGQIYKQYPVDLVYMAVNTNPPELNDDPGAPKRKLVVSDPKLVQPFALFTKDKILQIMFDEGQEDLVEITHSCTEQQIGRCNRCWQCRERAWAFKQLDKIDIGIK